MILADAIMQLFPGAVPQVDFALQDDGFGAYIAAWNLADPRPTRAELEGMGVVLGRKSMSVVKEWADLNRDLMTQAQKIIDDTATPSRLGTANGIPQRIAATGAGQKVADSGWTKERAESVNEMWVDFARWLQTPLPDSALAPIQILSTRDDDE